MEFENNEYRILDVQKVEGLKNDLCNDIDLFMSAQLDEKVGGIHWRGLEINPSLLYEASRDLDVVVNNIKQKPVARKITTLPDNFPSKLSIENEKLIKFLRSFKDY